MHLRTHASAYYTCVFVLNYTGVVTDTYTYVYNNHFYKKRDVHNVYVHFKNVQYVLKN